MGKADMDWYTAGNWNNDRISYNKEKNVLFFDEALKQEEATIKFPVPENAKSFSLSFKIGNRYPMGKPGTWDSAYVTVGFGAEDNSENVNTLRTPNVMGEEKFVSYSLGAAEKPVGIIGDPDFFYFKINASNARDDDLDVYFGDFELNFYDSTGAIQFSEYVPFKRNKTSEKVFMGDHMAGSLIGIYLLIAFIAAVFTVGVIKTKKQYGSHNEKEE